MRETQAGDGPMLGSGPMNSLIHRRSTPHVKVVPKHTHLAILDPEVCLAAVFDSYAGILDWAVRTASATRFTILPPISSTGCLNRQGRAAANVCQRSLCPGNAKSTLLNDVLGRQTL